MKSLQELHPNLSFEGIGGDNMKHHNLQSLASMDTFSIMGFTQVLFALPHLLKVRKLILDKLKSGHYIGVITIDMPAFSFWLGPAIKKLSIPHIHYVAPTVWAWKPQRAEKISKFLDAVLCLFPFEPPYFEKHLLKAPFVGHPLVEKFQKVSPQEIKNFRRRYGLQDDDKTLCLLPGSRTGEIRRHLPIFLKALYLFVSQVAHIHRPSVPNLIFLPVPKSKAHLVEDILSQENTFGLPPIRVITDDTIKPLVFQSSTVALAASGTVTLELACCQTPMIVAYETSALNAILAKHLLKTPYVAMVNILLNRRVVPEYLHKACRPRNLNAALKTLMVNPMTQIANLEAIPRLLTTKGLSPSKAAAQSISEIWKL